MGTVVRGLKSAKVIQGRGLAVKDRCGTSDPYVIIEVEKEKCKTKIIWKTLDPVWGEIFNMWRDSLVFFSFSRPVMDPVGATIKFTCWDKDKHSTDDFMGTFVIPGTLKH